MPRKSPDPELRDLSHEEEQAAHKEFLKDLRARKWKKLEIEAAEGGWEYAFDVGFEHPSADSDAARDLADCIIDGDVKRWRPFGGKEGVADLVYEGICAARRAQRDPAAVAREEAEREARRKELRAAIEAGRNTP